MITAIHKSLAKKRSMLENDDKGFTLIELLVVVLIIGILAAIAIPVFLGQQNGAKDSAAKSDLANAKIALIAYGTANNGDYPVPSGGWVSALKANGYSPTDGTTGFAVNPGASGSFCIQETSAASNTFSVTDSAGIKQQACA